LLLSEDDEGIAVNDANNGGLERVGARSPTRSTSRASATTSRRSDRSIRWRMRWCPTCMNLCCFHFAAAAFRLRGFKRVEVDGGHVGVA
jgi:hypothetical protein